MPGSGSYSTRIALMARSACSSVSAATSATASPMKRTFLSARTRKSPSNALPVSWVCPNLLVISLHGTSFAVSTARTPGMRSATLVSIESRRAAAYSLRKTLAYSMPGNSKSSAYLVWPSALSRASCRGMRCPMIL